MGAELLEGDGGFDHAESGSAIGRRRHHAEDTKLAQTAPIGPVDGSALADGQPLERKPVRAIAAHGLLERQLFVVEAEIHGTRFAQHRGII
jgi:hypothetical protein